MMTDYEKDMEKWKDEPYPIIDTKMPNPNDYDEQGYRKGTVTYEDGKVLDNYLIQTYGIEYARQNPLKTI